MRLWILEFAVSLVALGDCFARQRRVVGELRMQSVVPAQFCWRGGRWRWLLELLNYRLGKPRMLIENSMRCSAMNAYFSRA